MTRPLLDTIIQINRWASVFKFLATDQNLIIFLTYMMVFQVTVTLATLSFFCRRPTVVAIMEFVNAINIKDDTSESSSDNSSAAIVKQDVSNEDVVDDKYSMTVGEPVIKGLLGKGKSRIMFNIKLHMAHAQIFLMNDDETKLSSLSQDKLLTDIKVCLIFS